MRVGIIALHHESNTFLPQPTTLDHFRADVLATGEAIRALFATAHHEVGGYFEGLDRENVSAVPIFAARAIPSGVITRDTAGALVDQLLRGLGSAGSLNGLLLAAHGAAVAESERDFDGYWLSRVRQAAGYQLPIICTLDLHANVSPRMIASCDASIAYRTNPHLDQRDRGIEAATLMARTLRSEVKPTQAAAFPPIAINIERQLTEASPCRELMAMADEIRNRAGVLSASALPGFPYADVGEMGSSLIAVTNNNRTLAQSLADEMASYLVRHRQSFVGELISIDAAIEQAMQRGGPVCLLDIGDNIGGGSPGDGTALANALHARHAARAFVCLNDPAGVQQTRAQPIGATINLSIGGMIDKSQGPPLISNYRIIRFHDGRFEEPAPRHGGKTRFDMGPSTVLESDTGLTVLLTSHRTPPFSLNQLISCGIDPARFQILVAKGVHAPVAAYAPVCRSFIRANTPGLTTADMSLLTYSHRRRPLFPLEPIS